MKVGINKRSLLKAKTCLDSRAAMLKQQKATGYQPVAPMI
jgi:hypothetical protein